MILNHCLECQAKLVGRTDKKFCSDYCRNKHNNRRYAKSYAEINHINKILKKNFIILKDLYDKNLQTINLKEMIIMGFNCSYFTSIEKEENHNYFFCYTYGFKLNEEYVSIVKREITTYSF